MDLGLEANRNSALFSTMLQVLNIYNPLLHKARPMTVNGVKHRVKVQPTRWANTLDSWNGQKTVRFDLPRIGSIYNFSLQCAFDLPGEAPTAASTAAVGYRGSAKTTLTTGGLVNTNDISTNTARGRLDRVYADELLGFNMIESYTVMSKSRQIFSATGDYLLLRFSQMDEDMKKAVLAATTPKSMFSDLEGTYYAPKTMYQVYIPLFMFFNEHITNALDVNFTEEVYIEVKLRSPNELFYYGNLGDLYFVPALQIGGATGIYQYQGQSVGVVPWDQSTTAASYGFQTGTSYLTVTDLSQSGSGFGDLNVTAPNLTSYFGTANVADVQVANMNVLNFSTFGDAAVGNVHPIDEIPLMQQITLGHIRGLNQPMTSWNTSFVDIASAPFRYNNSTTKQYTEFGPYGWTVSGPTFAFPNVDNNGESPRIEFLGYADYLIQDTDAARALRAQQFPADTGLTQIVYDTQQETYRNFFSDASPYTNTLLSTESGGNFQDPGYASNGISDGTSPYYVDCQLRNNNLVMKTSFIVRAESDFGGSNNQVASSTTAQIGRTIATANKVLGAHRIYTRGLPVHSFQVLSAGRVIYESQGTTQLQLTQSMMYSGVGTGITDADTYYRSADSSKMPNDVDAQSSRALTFYTIDWGLQASRLENTGCLSLQNLNNPILRIYLKPHTWAEYPTEKNAAVGGVSEAMVAAGMGVRVDIIHEYFNVITINSGNGEITSGLNQ